MSNSPSRGLPLTTKIAATLVLVAAVAVTPILTAQPESEEKYSGEPITLSIKDADINDVLATFAEISGYEILVEPGVEGKVSMQIENEPWDGALVMILNDVNLGYQQEGRRIIVRQGDKGATIALMVPPDKAAPYEKVFNTTVHKYVEGGGIEPPKALEKLPPKYPPEMRKQGTSGLVVAELVIDQVGVVRDVAIQESPAEELSAAAAKAFEQWTFEPATMDGKRVAVRYIVTVAFRLE